MSGDKMVMRAWTRAQSRLGRRQAMPVMACGLLAGLVAVGQAWCVAAVLARGLIGSGTAAWPGAGLLLAALAGLAVLRALIMAGGDISAARAGRGGRRRLRDEVLGAILRGGPALLRRRHSAELTALAVDRIEALDGFFARWIPASVLWIAVPGLIATLAALVQPGAAVIMIVCGLAVPVGQAVFGIGAAVASRNQFLAMTRLQARFLDRVRGIATIVLLNRTDDEAGRLATAADELRRRTMKILRVAFLSSASIDCAMVVALVLIVVRDGTTLEVLRHGGASAPLADAAARSLFVLLLVPEFFAPLRALALAYQDRAHAAGAASAMGDLPEGVAAAVPAGGVVPQCSEGGVSVAFEHVTFAWDAARGSVLTDLSFAVRAGEILTLVGPSGAGKSTIIEMLLGFIVPGSGRVLVGGADLTAMAPATQSGLMSWIGQKPVLFAGTLRENILFARPDADEDALGAALRAASVDRFVADLPQGLDTPIGEGGFGLSGGQAQRVAIARAYLKDAPLLLLDEPTAHLDPETESEIFASLRILAQGRTVILSSHAAGVRAFAGPCLDLGTPRCLERGAGRMAPIEEGHVHV
ncbi:thiol reductant ABC exporter subunit CydD [Gluconacetobacter liquefaciens]|uniref:ATP-binding cassette subfamily C protein CydD n=1 Tax=Gluconacetobacter liquefaciens TaxID=89584 RepID=A0A370G4V9_GLULI|nr:thiol reductant ABC exporter subunit CydD [Gluconacetobacter liquefaciens]MBB2186257.1 thiol reductant ABC exporter subunit CydD [Gluconacetobacter liquefaciens]RDI38795.1 ATP-binding cassette subfamily C protein CydD [Gluconacetobacter liquefaciens]GEB36434.1 thiol reductant ABC exporter subunit CydD [Gluconacetobacter liquefaciens]